MTQRKRVGRQIIDQPSGHTGPSGYRSFSVLADFRRPIRAAYIGIDTRIRIQP